MHESTEEVVSDIRTIIGDFKTNIAGRLTRLEDDNKRLKQIGFRMTATGGDATAATLQTLSAQLTSDQNFQAWHKSSKTPYSSFAVEMKLPERKATTISGISPVTPIPGIWGPATPVARLRDFLPRLPVATGVAEFVQETAFTGNAAIAVETTIKPAADATFALVNQKVSTVATTIRLSLQTFSDMPALSLWLDQRMTSNVLLAEEKIFVNGDTPNAVQGLLQVAPVFSYTPPTSDNPADAIARAVGDLMGRGYRVDCIVLNSTDFTALQLLKDTVGSYIFLPGGNSAPDNAGVWEGQPSLWNLPVVISAAMPAGTFLVGSFFSGAILFDREALNVQISYEDQDNFIKNLVTVRAELRSALAVAVPAAFWQGTIAAPGTAAANGTQHSAPHVSRK
jgi:HK97 family phage major capsid protein